MSAPVTQKPTARLLLAGVVLAMCGLGAGATWVMGATGWCIAFAVVGVIALIGIVAIAARKHREAG